MNKATFFKLGVGFVYLNEIFVALHSVTQNCCHVIELMLLVLFFGEKGVFQRIWWVCRSDVSVFNSTSIAYLLWSISCG